VRLREAVLAARVVAEGQRRPVEGLVLAREPWPEAEAPLRAAEARGSGRPTVEALPGRARAWRRVERLAVLLGAGVR
jgi:hypothetical protein